MISKTPDRRFQRTGISILSFGIEKLEQTGRKHIVNGVEIKSRKKTNNKWYETQDSIKYWNDFSKQKIIYPETTQGAYFYLDNEGFYIDKTCFFMICDAPEYLVATLSSTLFEFAYKHIFSSIELGISGYQYNKHALLLLPILPLKKVSKQELSLLNKYVHQVFSNEEKRKREMFINAIDDIIYSLYNISEMEKTYIKSQNKSKEFI